MRNGFAAIRFLNNVNSSYKKASKRMDKGKREYNINKRY